VVASGTVENATARESSFVIQLSIRSRTGERLYATAAATEAIAAHDSAQWTAPTSARFQPGMQCVVTGLSRR
jgi:hypothetical protein